MALDPKLKNEYPAPEVVHPEKEVTNKKTEDLDSKRNDINQLDILNSIKIQLSSLNQSVEMLQEFNEDGISKVLCGVESKLELIYDYLKNSCSPRENDTNFGQQSTVDLIKSIVDKLDKNDRQLTQSLRDNATFQIQVRQGMQSDLDSIREQLSGEQYNSILKDIASIYVEYKDLLLSDSTSELSKKNIQSLFEQIEDILNDYGAEVSRSEVGTIRQARACKIIEKIPTSEEEKHNTIVISRKPGVFRGRNILYPEFVDVYVYDPLHSVKNVNEPIKNEEHTLDGTLSESTEQTINEFHTNSAPENIENDDINLGGNNQ